MARQVGLGDEQGNDPAGVEANDPQRPQTVLCTPWTARFEVGAVPDGFGSPCLGGDPEGVGSSRAGIGRAGMDTLASPPDALVAEIRERHRAVRERIAAACHRAGRDPEAVTLVAVSKTH